MVWDHRDSDVDLDEAQRHILVPRWGIDIHTKAREGYSLGGFMWERPYLSVAPSYGHRLLVNCAGLLSAVPSISSIGRVLRANDTWHKSSPSVESEFRV